MLQDVAATPRNEGCKAMEVFQMQTETGDEMSEINANYILQTALDALSQRASIRDQPSGERSAKKAASILSAWTGREWVENDVWRCLLAVKLARESQGSFHVDDVVDLAGYAGLLGESRAKLEIE